jgi:DNA (cytosine-5)-methyltransferase 1
MFTQLNKFKIRELMAKKEIKTQSELAKMLGISKNQLSIILSNRFDPVKSNVNELAEFLGVNPLDLIEKKENEKDETE